MKKLLMALALMLPIALVSCSDENSLPNVEFNVSFEDVVKGSDGALYVVQGESFDITGIKVVNLEPEKMAIITSATYYWDGLLLGTSYASPYGTTINTTEDTPLGEHELQISCPLYAVDKEASRAWINYTVVVVADESELPDVPATATYTVSPVINQ